MLKTCCLSFSFLSISVPVFLLLSFCLFVSVCFSFFLSDFVFLSFCLPFYLSACLSFCLPPCLSFCFFLAETFFLSLSVLLSVSIFLPFFEEFSRLTSLFLQNYRDMAVHLNQQARERGQESEISGGAAEIQS